MKKVAIVVVIVIIFVVGIYFFKNANVNIEKVLEPFEIVESDGFYDNVNNKEASGYIVSNKTKEGYRYGYVNYKGKILLEPEYNSLHRIIEIENKDKVYIIAAKNGRYGVSLNGKTIIEYEYQSIIYDNISKIYILQKTEKYGVANIEGEIILPVENDLVEAKGIYIYVTKQEEQKVYDKDGNLKEIDFNTEIIPTDNPNYFLTILNQDDNYIYGVVDKEGKELISSRYLYIEYLFETYFIACDENNMQGIIDEKGEIKLKFEYDLVQKIQNTNIIMAKINEKNETKIFNNKLENICNMQDATIENIENGIKIYNSEEEKKFNLNGIEI